MANTIFVCARLVSGKPSQLMISSHAILKEVPCMPKAMVTSCGWCYWKRRMRSCAVVTLRWRLAGPSRRWLTWRARPTGLCASTTQRRRRWWRMALCGPSCRRTMSWVTFNLPQPLARMCWQLVVIASRRTTRQVWWQDTRTRLLQWRKWNLRVWSWCNCATPGAREGWSGTAIGPTTLRCGRPRFSVSWVLPI